MWQSRQSFAAAGFASPNLAAIDRERGEFNTVYAFECASSCDQVTYSFNSTSYALLGLTEPWHTDDEQLATPKCFPFDWASSGGAASNARERISVA